MKSVIINSISIGVLILYFLLAIQGRMVRMKVRDAVNTISHCCSRIAKRIA